MQSEVPYSNLGIHCFTLVQQTDQERNEHKDKRLQGTLVSKVKSMGRTPQENETEWMGGGGGGALP